MYSEKVVCKEGLMGLDLKRVSFKSANKFCYDVTCLGLTQNQNQNALFYET